MNPTKKIIDDAKNVFEIESKELINVKKSIDESFANAVLEIFNSKGKCIITGMGKSGIIGRKIAASLSSTGTSSFFVHPGEAFHGDLGMFEKGDVVILLSNSGETDEILKLISFFQYQGNKTISITGDTESTLALNTSHHILCKVEKEACPLQLAPTSSTTAAIAIGDAIVVSLINLRKFKPENFARFHPGGSLGKKLLATVDSVMSTDNLPLIADNTKIIDVIHTISNSGYGIAIIAKSGKLEGIITDGDIRRAMENHQANFFALTAINIATNNVQTVSPNSLLSEAETTIRAKKINSLVVISDNKTILGLINIKQVV